MSVYGEMNHTSRAMADIGRRLADLRKDGAANAAEIEKLLAEREGLDCELSCLRSEARREAAADASWDERECEDRDDE